ncbi:MAG: DUF4442 domain-containing protein [Oligoflexia bacterium]|nr:DUF4442 domain-containing protein [Oligoflexia bacterium]
MRHKLLYLWNLYPPFLGAGIRITHISKDLRLVRAQMKLRFWNRNYVGTHFGGSLYSLCDAFHMVILLNKLNTDFIVRDKGASVRFLKKALGKVTVDFSIEEKEFLEIKKMLSGEVQVRTYIAKIIDDNNETVCEIEKHIHIRRK